MQPAMNIGVVGRVKITERLNHCKRFLSRGRIVQIDERLAMNLACEDRKILSYLSNVESWTELNRSAHCSSSVRESCARSNVSIPERTPSCLMRPTISLAKA